MIRLAVCLEIRGDEENASSLLFKLLADGVLLNDIEKHNVPGVGPMVVKCAYVRNAPRYRVRYYDRVKSHRGKGVQVRTFDDLEDAREFAAENVLYTKPCVVEVE